MNIKCILILTFLFQFVINGQTQSTYNFNQLNYNTLLINPAYAGQVENLSMQASYSGLVGGSVLIGAPQLYNFSIHNKLANPAWGLGGILEIDKFNTRTAVSVQPSLARYFKAGDSGKLSVGLQSRLQFINFGSDASILVPDNIFLATAGLGVFYSQQHFFLSLSAPTILHKSTISKESPSRQIGERPLYVYTGYWLEVTEFVKIKAAVLGNRTQFFEYPTSTGQALSTKTEWGLNINGIFSDRYWFGVGYGQVQNDDALSTADYQYINLSAVYAFNIARISYSYLQRLGNQNLSINTLHTILLEFDIKDGGREKIIRYF